MEDGAFFERRSIPCQLVRIYLDYGGVAAIDEAFTHRRARQHPNNGRKQIPHLFVTYVPSMNVKGALRERGI